ncbi:MAG: DNA alkylation repair protein [Actinomycetota bacterium]
MAELLKDQFGHDVAERIAAALEHEVPDFDAKAFVRDCLDGFDELELTGRAKHIAAAMAAHLPADRAEALRVVTRSLGEEGDQPWGGMEGFFYLPHVYFVAEHGLDHFEEAMAAQYELTKRFTAEFSIRAYLEAHPEATLARLREWTSDPNEHPRRLVSEGTRPRLPWASRLKAFQADPAPVIELLELLKDDESEYVRRSVANNLNDIAKDHPELVVELAGRWWADADENRRRLIRHGLRTLIKAGDAGALAVLGYGPDSPLVVRSVTVEPQEVPIGGKVRVDLLIENPAASTVGGLIDLRLHFVKANGETSPKVFKGSEIEVAPGDTATFGKSISVKQHSTRTHYPGTHRVEVLVNGEARPGPSFELLPE